MSTSGLCWRTKSVPRSGYFTPAVTRRAWKTCRPKCREMKRAPKVVMVEPSEAALEYPIACRNRMPELLKLGQSLFSMHSVINSCVSLKSFVDVAVQHCEPVAGRIIFDSLCRFPASFCWRNMGSVCNYFLIVERWSKIDGGNNRLCPLQLILIEFGHKSCVPGPKMFKENLLRVQMPSDQSNWVSLPRKLGVFPAIAAKLNV